jgi:tetratricopeptide (TPR) repeat protein
VTSRGEPPPLPVAVHDLDDLARGLLGLRAWAGNPSYAALAVAVGEVRARRGQSSSRPGKVTVYDCFRAGRRRIDPELFLDLAEVLGVPDADLAQWRRAWQTAMGLGPEDDTAALSSAEVPAPRSRLVGREPELGRLVARGPGTVSTIVGLPGAGKTELALHLVHRWRTQLPPGSPVLGVDLRGFDSALAPLAPEAVLARLLQGLGTPPRQYEALDPSARRSLFWRTMGQRPSVIVLDNAATAEQILPLLPVAARSRVVVTSRRSLPGLDGPREVLAELAETAAVELLGDRTGRARVADEPAAALRIVRRCGRLALDLTVAGDMVAANPGWTLADHASRLEALPRDALSRPALQMSYAALPQAVRRTFRMCALHPGPRPRASQVAALAGVGLEEATRHLELLAADHLVRRVDSDAYVLHDVLRTFALRQGVLADARSEQASAMHALGRALLAEAGDHARPMGQSAAWMVGELDNVMAFAAVTQAWQAGRSLVPLASQLVVPLVEAGRLDAAEELVRRALGVAAPADERALRRALGRVLEIRGDLAAALEEFYRVHDETHEDAEREWNGIANVLKRMGRFREAVTCYRRAAMLAEQRGNDWTRARALGNLGNVVRILGHLETAESLMSAAEMLSLGVDDEVNVSIINSNQVLLALDRGDLDATVELARSLLSSNPEPVAIAAIDVRHVLARALTLRGDLVEAEAELGLAWVEVRATDFPELLCELRCVRALLSIARGDLAAAEQDLLRVVDEATSLGLPLPAIEADNTLGVVASARGDLAAARSLHERAASSALALGDTKELHRARTALAALPAGRPAPAAEVLSRRSR